MSSLVGIGEYEYVVIHPLHVWSQHHDLLQGLFAGDGVGGSLCLREYPYQKQAQQEYESFYLFHIVY